MQTFYSQDIVTGTYVRARIVVQEVSQSIIGNQTVADIFVQMWRTNTGYTTEGAGTLHIGVNGDDVSSSITHSQKITYNSYTTIGDKRRVTLTHDANGDWSGRISARADTSNSNMSFGETSFKVDLTHIDRTAPRVSLSVSDITENTFKTTVQTDAQCNAWWYSLDGGASWVKFSTVSAVSASCTIRGLVPNGTYRLQVCARKQSNQVDGYSDIRTVKTLGGSVLNSVSDLQIDAENPVLNMNLTVYANYTHSLEIKDGENFHVLTIDDLTASNGTINKSIVLTSEQQQIILRYMRSKKEITARFQLTTYSGTTKIGNTSVKEAVIKTSSEYSAPHFSGFTHNDCNTKTVDVTENDKFYIKGYSDLHLSLDTAVAQNYASVSSYRVTVGETRKEFTETDINFGKINDAGDVKLTVEAIDSRGYATAIEKTITVIDYTDISITKFSIRRKNEVESTVQLSFSGDISFIDDLSDTFLREETGDVLCAENNEPLQVKDSQGSESCNWLVSVKIRYRPSNGFWSDWYVPIVEEEVRGFSYETLALSDTEGKEIKFDPNLQYTVEIHVADRLSEDNVYLPLNKGIPLVSFRDKKIGINTAEPQGALDVCDGNILMNGYNVQGFVRSTVKDEDLNGIQETGVYIYANNGKNSPVYAVGILEVFSYGAFVLQRITAFTAGNKMFIRSYPLNGEWQPWREI